MKHNLFFITAVISIATVRGLIVPPHRSFTTVSKRLPNHHHLHAVTENVQDVTSQSTTGAVQSRKLGSQELLMLPRQYGPHINAQNRPFPQMNHICVVTLSHTPSLTALQDAIDEAMATHPLLRSFIQGDGEPEKRIDLLQMVRQGEPNPLTFVAPSLDQGTNTRQNDYTSVLRVLDHKVEQACSHDNILHAHWEHSFRVLIDDDSWCNITQGPLWKLEFHRLLRTDTDSNHVDLSSALVFSFNHAISDQTSVNILVDQLLTDIVSIEQSKSIHNPAIRQILPMSLEESILGMHQTWSDIQMKGVSIDTLRYVAGKAVEGFKHPVILPDDTANHEQDNTILQALTIIAGKSPGGKSDDTTDRRSAISFRKLPQSTTEALLTQCRENGVTMSNALSTAMTLTSSDFINGGKEVNKKRTYKVLQSLDMRRFGNDSDKFDSFRCMAGSHDLLLGPIADGSGKGIRSSRTYNGLNQDTQTFWTLAKETQAQTNTFIDSSGPEHATRVFDFAMSVADMNNLIHLTAQSKESQGRAYSAGIVNVGVFEKQKAVRRQENMFEPVRLRGTYGKYKVQEIYFATSHARTGSLYQASCMTVAGELQCTFHPSKPLISEETNGKFADAFIDLLNVVAGVNHSAVVDSVESMNTPSLLRLPKNMLTYIAATYGACSIIVHAQGWNAFLSSVIQMKEGVQNPEEFWSALNFWIFFAVGHPLLQPILSISEILHGTPGPKIGDLIPLMFLMGNVFAIAILSLSKEIRNAVNVFALSAFLAYVGAGLDGQGGLGDFNLGLDDSYKGRTIRGCPTYESVRQNSMDNFDIAKYQGKWYEQKFHDWTQFKEVYDTTLDIKLTSDGKGWVDDFGVKGPSQAFAPLSWDKSPVANGAHYFLFGRIDERDSPGVLRESGFGVEFPNYIVDVQKDPVTGEYTEAIQFQCLERGGVRVFEGINFMSRKPTMTPDELSAMHLRAKNAGMYPYGADPEQMHTVLRRPIDSPPIDNAWQRMWKSIGLDRLLELLSESIEDGGR